jgi:hypothetical protein
MALMDEHLLSLHDAAKILPVHGAKRIHMSTLWRWCRKGIGGVRLEYLRVGRRIITSREAMGRFFEAVAKRDEVPGEGTADPPHFQMTRAPAERLRDIERAERELQNAGI